MIVGYARCSTDAQDLTAQGGSSPSLLRPRSGSTSIRDSVGKTAIGRACGKLSPRCTPVTPCW